MIESFPVLPDADLILPEDFHEDQNQKPDSGGPFIPGSLKAVFCLYPNHWTFAYLFCCLNLLPDS